MTFMRHLLGNNPNIRNDLNRRFTIDDEELFGQFISHWSSRWEKKPYPNLAALANTHEKATRYDSRSAAVNPLTVIDLHYVKELDQSGFIGQLYR